jgi:hypothetical protein
MGDTRLGAVDLPDGFRSTIAWLVDLCASWHAIAPERAASGDHREIRALVVIDEIDLHLHPRLQRVLVPRLREALPRVQWIVSTHSPLVLGCFDRRENVMLARDEAGHVTQREVDRQVAGFSTDEIYEWLMETPARTRELMNARRVAPRCEASPDALPAQRYDELNHHSVLTPRKCSTSLNEKGSSGAYNRRAPSSRTVAR